MLSMFYTRANEFYLQGPDAVMRQEVRKGRIQTPNVGELNLDFESGSRRVSAAEARLWQHLGSWCFDQNSLTASS